MADLRVFENEAPSVVFHRDQSQIHPPESDGSYFDLTSHLQERVQSSNVVVASTMQGIVRGHRVQRMPGQNASRQKYSGDEGWEGPLLASAPVPILKAVR